MLHKYGMIIFEIDLHTWMISVITEFPYYQQNVHSWYIFMSIIPKTISTSAHFMKFTLYNILQSLQIKKSILSQVDNIHIHQNGELT